MLRNFLVDWALRRARAAAGTANTCFDRKRGKRVLTHSEWWHDVAAWLDGIGAGPGLPGGRRTAED